MASRYWVVPPKSIDDPRVLPIPSRKFVVFPNTLLASSGFLPNMTVTSRFSLVLARGTIAPCKHPITG
ncbi:MAG TPA: hypothetical protein DCP73_04470 [Chloroflexi bacterium]|nr:hypothetical protein [Chloroflexota bacterium]